MSGYTSAVMIGTMVAGTAMQAMGTIASGNAAKAQGEAARVAAEYEAKQREVIAGQERAASQRNMLTEKKEAELVSSRALAVSAASGGGVLDPTVVDLLGDIESEGEYRAMMELYGGEERARGQEHAASVRRYEGEMAYSAGKAAQRNSRFAAAGQLLTGFGKAGMAAADAGMFDGTKTPPTSAGSRTVGGKAIRRSMWSRYG